MKRVFYLPLVEPRDEATVKTLLSRSGWHRLYLESDWEQCTAVTVLKSYMEKEFAFNGQDQPRGLYLTGSVGVGKTSALALIAQWLGTYYGAPCRFVSTALLFDMHYEKNYQAINSLMESTILFIDDLGREYPADYGMIKFENFIEHRYANLLTTFFTSNVSIQDLRSRVGFERIADRVNDPKWMNHLTMAGTSKRVRP